MPRAELLDFVRQLRSRIRRLNRFLNFLLFDSKLCDVVVNLNKRGQASCEGEDTAKYEIVDLHVLFLFASRFSNEQLRAFFRCSAVAVLILSLEDSHIGCGVNRQIIQRINNTCQCAQSITVSNLSHFRFKPATCC